MYPRSIGIRSLSFLLAITFVFPVCAQRNLKDIPDVDPAKELASFQVADGFEVNLYISDPHIAKPIQMNFDAQGRLWIASSEVYPHIKPGDPATDKILVVEDVDRDGRADKTTVFADGLLIPTGVVPGDGGAYVVNSTELLHFEDTNGDLKADIRRVVLSGFGSEDTHHLLHTLRWGHDGALYMNQSIYIHSHVETPHGVRRLLGGGIWQFRPESMKLEIICHGFVNPWGHHFDFWGQSFATDGAYGEGINYVFPGAVFVTAPGLKRRLAGLNPGSPKHCGLEILSGRHLPASWRGSMVTNDFRAHRVCRFTVTEEGAGYSSRQEPELITTSHQAFRPIDVKMGPDGAIYIADWYNPIIQHGEVDFRDERRDHAHGRIWRVTAKGRPLTPRIDPRQLSIAELISHLSDPEDWVRLNVKLEMKHRDGDKVQAGIERWLDRLDPAEPLYIHNRLEALWSLRSIGRLPVDLIREICQSPEPRARAAALRVLSENTAVLDCAFPLLSQATEDLHPRVRLEAVRGLSHFQTTAAVESVVKALDQPVDRFLDFAIWQALRDLQPSWEPAFGRGEFTFGGNTDHIVYAIRAAESPDAGKLLVSLIGGKSIDATQKQELIQIVADLGTAEDLAELLLQSTAELKEAKTAEAAIGNILVLCEASRARKITPENALELIEAWRASETTGLDLTSLRAIGYWKLNSLKPVLDDIVAAGSAGPSLLAAIDGLGAFDDPATARALVVLGRDPAATEMAPAIIGALTRNDLDAAATLVVEKLVAREEGFDIETALPLVLRRQGGGDLLASKLSGKTIDSVAAKMSVRLVLASPRPSGALIEALRQSGRLAQSGWKLTPGFRDRILQAVRESGDASLGESIYRRRSLQCTNCHAIGGAGGRVGPDLVSVGASAPDDYLLESIIEPNKKVKENFHSTIILDADGQVHSGITIREDTESVVIRNPLDEVISIPKADIDQRREGRSLMPDGGADSLTEEELVHLIRFLSELGEPGGDFSVGTRQLARRWQFLVSTKESQFRLRRTSYDSVVREDPAYRWNSAYSLVSGELPLSAGDSLLRFPDGAAVKFFRSELQVNRQGVIRIKLDDPRGLSVWIDDDPVEARGTINLPLDQGLHRITVAVDVSVRTTPLLFELPAPASGAGQAQWVTGK
jgi:putative heme-binding domain-containing protein